MGFFDGKTSTGSTKWPRQGRPSCRSTFWSAGRGFSSTRSTARSKLFLKERNVPSNGLTTTLLINVFQLLLGCLKFDKSGYLGWVYTLVTAHTPCPYKWPPWSRPGRQGDDARLRLRFESRAGPIIQGGPIDSAAQAPQNGGDSRFPPGSCLAGP